MLGRRSSARHSLWPQEFNSQGGRELFWSPKKASYFLRVEKRCCLFLVAVLSLPILISMMVIARIFESQHDA